MALFGSFLNVLIWRGPMMWGLVDKGAAPRGNLFTPRSYCPACHGPILARNNIPLLSYFLLRGGCANCGAKISQRYILVEGLGAVTMITVLMVFGLSLSAVLGAFFLLVLIALAVIDWETGYLPDMLTLPLVAIGIGANAIGLFVPLKDALIGAVAGYIGLWLIATFYRNARGREGLGLGDAKLLAALGAWSGWMALPVTVLIASLTALAIVGIQHLRGRNIPIDATIPFGPALALAGAVIFVYVRPDV